ncbi:hypothetical protein [Butyrivibrio sp. AC2005]|uniref:hypothetical protein n=1 Tax=Butyrivibrio sp. AC2005 TaxID=1280672 RepID=UPI000413931D|nr:hypothetical protein [Butyrivibrio sp. AC2005]
MGDRFDHDVAKGKNVQETKALVLPDGYEFFGEVDIEKITDALENYADRVSLAR